MPLFDAPSSTFDSGLLYDDVPPAPQLIRKNMAKVKFSFKGVPDTDALQLCTNLKTALTGNANFPTPPVTLAAFGTQLAASQTKLTASDNIQASAKQATADKDTSMDVTKGMAMQIVGYVDLIANGDESKILSAGLSVRAPKTPASVPGQVQNLSVTAGDNDGSLDTQWDPLPGAKTYETQTSPEPMTSTSFVTRDTVTNSRVTLTGFTSGARIWARVRAINSAGKGPWSDPAVKVVP